MKIQTDHIVRDMTPEEEAEFLANTDTDTEATESDYINALQDLGVSFDE